jgi:hypothetical protein
MIHIFDCEPGDIVKLCFNKRYLIGIDCNHGNNQIVEAKILSVSENRCLIGFDDDQKIHHKIGWPILGNEYMVENPKLYPTIDTKYGWWLSENLLVEVADMYLDADLKCDVCNRPAPHGKPNHKDGIKFICFSCAILKQLIE